jgi:hypothetical protein
LVLDRGRGCFLAQWDLRLCRILHTDFRKRTFLHLGE